MTLAPELCGRVVEKLSSRGGADVPRVAAIVRIFGVSPRSDCGGGVDAGVDRVDGAERVDVDFVAGEHSAAAGLVSRVIA